MTKTKAIKSNPIAGSPLAAMLLFASLSALPVVAADVPEQAVWLDTRTDFCRASYDDPNNLDNLRLLVTDKDGNGTFDYWDAADIEVSPAEAEVFSVFDRGASSAYIRIRTSIDYLGEISVRVRGINYRTLSDDIYGTWSPVYTVTQRNASESVSALLDGADVALQGDVLYEFRMQDNFDSYRSTSRSLSGEIETLYHSYNPSMDYHAVSCDFPPSQYTGSFTFRTSGKNKCGWTQGYTEKTITLVAIPQTPFESSGRTFFQAGETVLFKCSNTNPAASYSWDFQPASAVEKTSNADGSCSVRFINSSYANIQVRLRARVDGREGPYSPIKKISVAAPPEAPQIEGPHSTCYSGLSNKIYYKASSPYPVVWDISGSGVSLQQSGNSAVVTLSEEASQFEIRARATNGYLETPWTRLSVSVTSGQVDIDFGNINPCSGQGNISLTGIQPSGGIYWVNGRESTTTVYATDYLAQQGTGNVTGENSSSSLFGKYYEAFRENILRFSFSSVPSGATVISARLILQISSYAGQNVRGSFGSLSATLNPGAAASYYESVKAAPLSMDAYRLSANSAIFELDVTQLVSAWVGTGTCHGLYLDPEPYEGNNVYFYTHLASPTLRPRIEVTYALDNTINTNQAGVSYTISYKFNQGACYSLESSPVTVLERPEVSFLAPEYCADQIPAVLSGGSANIPGSGVYLGDGVNNNTLYSDSPGAHPVTYRFTAANGCQASVTKEVIVNPNPACTITSVDASCGGIPIMASIPPGVFAAVSWRVDGQSAGSQNSVSFTPPTSFKGTRHLEVDLRDYKGCQSTIEKDIWIHETPRLSLSDRTACRNTLLQYTPDDVYISEGGLDYRWSNGAVTDHLNIYVQAAQSYSLTVTSDNGCQQSDQMNILALDLPSVSLAGDEICLGESATLQGLPFMPTWNYRWSNGASGSTVSYLASETGANPVTVWVEDQNGCSNSATAMVQVNGLPEFSLTDQDACAGVPATISAPPGYRNYHWSTGATGSPAISVSPPSTQSYSCQVEDHNGCKSTRAMTLTIHAPMPLIMPDRDACQGDRVTLSAPAGFSSYQWSNGVSYPQIEVLADQTRSYTLEVKDPNGCQNASTFTLFSHPYPILSMPDVGINQGEARDISAPPGYAQYLWSTGQLSESIQVSPGQTTDYWLEISTPASCSARDTFTVFVYDLPQVDMPDVFACQGDQLTFEAPQGYVDYRWTSGQDSWSGRVIHPQAQSSCLFNLELTNEYGGKGGTSFTLTVFEKPILTCHDTLICKGTRVTLSTRQGYAHYLWSSGDTLPFTEVSPQVTQRYNLMVTSADNCSSQGEILVRVDNPFTEFTASQGAIRPGDPVQFYVNTINPGYAYSWDFGDGLQAGGSHSIHYYYQEGLFDVRLTTTSENHCIAENLKTGFISVDEHNTDLLSADFTAPHSLVRLYPNPARDRVWVDLQAYGAKEYVTISLYTLNNLLVQSLRAGSGQIFPLELGDLPPGTYLVGIESAHERIIQKLIKGE